jgi:hypothetical protein
MTNDELFEVLKKLADEHNGKHSCPNCGYCPHCGRGAAPYNPYPYYPSPAPTTPWPGLWDTWCSDVTAISGSFSPDNTTGVTFTGTTQ